MASKASANGRQCEKDPNHWLDPTWDFCPYCKAEQRGKERSQPDQSSVASNSKRKPTQVSSDSQQPSRKQTKVMPDRQASRQGNSPPPTRGKRIVAVLMTYSRPDRPEGSLFPICEGTNYIGAGNIGSEAAERPCDILVEEDSEMSSEHALIRYVKGIFEIVDNKTTNATYVNDQMIPMLQGYRLDNYAEIKTGRTVWKFVIIDPSGAPKKTIPQPEEELKSQSPPKGDGTKIY